MDYFWLFPLLFLIPAVILLVMASSMSRNSNPTSRRLVRIERDLHMVMDHLGIVRPEPTVEVLDKLRAGKKLEAVVVYRDATGVGLKEAREAVEKMAREHGL